MIKDNELIVSFGMGFIKNTNEIENYFKKYLQSINKTGWLNYHLIKINLEYVNEISCDICPDICKDCGNFVCESFNKEKLANRFKELGWQ